MEEEHHTPHGENWRAERQSKAYPVVEPTNKFIIIILSFFEHNVRSSKVNSEMNRDGEDHNFEGKPSLQGVNNVQPPVYASNA